MKPASTVHEGDMLIAEFGGPGWDVAAESRARRLWAAFVIARNVWTCESILLRRPVIAAHLDVRPPYTYLLRLVRDGFERREPDPRGSSFPNYVELSRESLN